MKREEAYPYVSWIVDDSLNAIACNDVTQLKSTDTLIGWQCGFEPLFVAVRSYLSDTQGNQDILGMQESEDIAIDFLLERNWFTNPNNTGCDHCFVGEEESKA